MKLPICDITPFTVQDFPNHTACIMWFGGCNMRCSYCHNPELVLGKKKRMKWEEISSFLSKRKGLLDGVVLTGGECTISKNIPEFIEYIRKLDMKVKLDTNGLRPDVLENLLARKLIDYVAIDYKAPEKKFLEITKTSNFNEFHNSLDILCKSSIDFEVRTTVHTHLLNENDIAEIIEDLEKLNFKGNYYIQNFQPSPENMEPTPEQKHLLNLDLLSSTDKFKIHTRNF